MTKAGERLLEGAREALAIAKGEQPAARITIHGHAYVPEDRWQPIEAAPTNRAILVHVPNTDYYGNDGVYAAMQVDMGTGKRWMTFGWAIGRDLGEENTPDGWMPIPAAPSALA